MTVRALRKDVGVEEKAAVPIRIRTTKAKEALFEDGREIVERMAKVSGFEFTADLPEGAGVRSTANFDVAVVYEKQIDVAAETARLTKELAQFEKEIVNADRQLGNDGFLAKAPASVVDGIRKRRGELEILIAKARTALDAFGNSTSK